MDTVANASPSQGSTSQNAQPTANYSSAVSKTQSAQPAGTEIHSDPKPKAPTPGQPSGATQANQSAEAKALEALGPEFDDKAIQLEINGQVEMVPIKEARKLLQLGKVSEATYQQIKQARKQAQAQKQELESLVSLARSNPLEFLQATGVDPDEWAERRLAEKLKLLEMTPEQRRIYELEMALQEREGKLKTVEEQERQKVQRVQEDRYAQQVDQELAQALQTTGLPKKKEWAQLVALEVAAATKRDENLSFSQAAVKVLNRFDSQMRERIGSMDLNQLRELVGSRLDELRQADISRVRNQTDYGKPSPEAKPASKKTPEYFTRESDYRAWVESL